jgi:hypothetical protein
MASLLLDDLAPASDLVRRADGCGRSSPPDDRGEVER